MDIVNPILVKNKKEQTKTVALSMGAGDQTIIPDAGKVLSSVTVEKPATLVPSNIKDGVNIGGITGDYTAPTPTLITKNITANGTYSASSDNADGYSQVVVNVSGGIVEAEEKDVNFYDYDGTRVASYSAADFANLASLPANPSHTGLVAEGWNWTLADAKTYVASYGKLNIGQVYHTASGKTEYDIVLTESTGLSATLGLSGTEKDWGDGTIDTNESHTYAAYGSYTIKLSGTTLPSISYSKKAVAVRIASGVTEIGNNVFVMCVNLKIITIPNTVTRIGRFFNNLYSLKSITIPFSVSEILGAGLAPNQFAHCFSIEHIVMARYTNFSRGVYAKGCSSLKSITISNSQNYQYTNIAANAFESCYELKSITIPNTITEIGEKAFNNCLLLQEIVLPSSITSIGNEAFRGDGLLTEVTVLATTPPTLGTDVFQSSVTKIYIPNGTLAAYQTAWADYSALFVELPA